MIGAAAIGILVTMALAIARAIFGPSVFDRVLAVNTFGTMTVLLIAVINFLSGRPEFLDLALVYAILNFLGTIALLRYTLRGTFDDVAQDGDKVSP